MQLLNPILYLNNMSKKEIDDWLKEVSSNYKEKGLEYLIGLSNEELTLIDVDLTLKLDICSDKELKQIIELRGLFRIISKFKSELSKGIVLLNKYSE
jgi:hypothetical protein